MPRNKISKKVTSHLENHGVSESTQTNLGDFKLVSSLQTHSDGVTEDETVFHTLSADGRQLFAGNDDQFDQLVTLLQARPYQVN